MGTNLKQTESIEHYGRCAARKYAEEFPGQKLDANWLGTAYEYDSASEDWPDNSYDEIYEPAAREEFRSLGK